MRLLLTAPAFAMFLLCSVPALSDDAGTAGNAETESGTAINISTKVPDNAILIGRAFEIEFKVEYRPGTRVYFPKNPDTRPLALIGVKSDDRTVIGTGTSEKHVLGLLPIRSGEAVLKPFEIPVVLPDGQTTTVMTPEIRMEVSGALGNEEAPDLASPGDARPVIVRNDLLIWAIAALLAAGLAAATAILAYRRWRAFMDARKPAPPPVPPHERAKARLAEIEELGLIESRDFKTLALLVSEVIREFLGSILGFPGTDSTTWETIDSVRNLAGRNGTSGPDIFELEDFLAMCDLIKFAKFEPSESDAQALLRRAGAMVDSVKASPLAGFGAESPIQTKEGSDEI